MARVWLAIVLSVAMLGVAACGDSGEGSGATQSDATVASDGGGLSDAEAAAMAAAERYVGAEASADVTSIGSMLQASLGERERQRYLFFASWPTHLVNECEVIQATDFLSEVVCLGEVTDPVWVHQGSESILMTYKVWSDGMTVDFGGQSDLTGPNMATRDTYADTVKAFAEYLQQVWPNEYSAACDPAAHDITATVQEFGLTLVPECGELVASVATQAAEWLEAGQ